MPKSRTRSRFSRLAATSVATATMFAGLSLPASPASASRPGEHHLINSLVDDKHAPVSSVASGNWADASTWAGGHVPTEGDRVVITSGHEVTIRSKIAGAAKTVRVDGTLTFASNVDSELRVDTLVVSHHGRLQVGSEANPIEADKSARIVIDDFNNGFETEDKNSPDYDPNTIGQGVISMGSIEIHGAQKSPYATISQAPMGTTVLTPKAFPTGWRVGDKVAIAGASYKQEEVRTVTGLDATAGTVTLDQALEFDHIPPSESAPVDLEIHVANLTRNASIETVAGNEDSLHKRGHTMSHNNNVDIRNAAFVNMGRTDKKKNMSDTIYDSSGEVFKVGTNQRARYSFHIHRAGQTGLANIEGSVVDGNPGWGFVNHSSNADFVNNVAFDVVGAAFVTENGDENGTFVGNLAMRTIGRYNTPLQSKVAGFGHRGDGFWFQGLAIRVVDNVAVGSSGHAFAFWGATANCEVCEVWSPRHKRFLHRKATGKPKMPASLYDDPSVYGGPNAKVKAQDMYIEQFSGNTTYANRDHALLIASHSPSNRKVQSKTDNFTVWGTNRPMAFRYMAGVTMTDYTLIGTGGSTATYATHRRPKHLRFENWHVENFSTAIAINAGGTNVISGGYFDTETGVNVIPKTIKRGRGKNRRVITLSGPGPTVENSPVFGPNTGTEIKGSWTQR